MVHCPTLVKKLWRLEFLNLNHVTYPLDLVELCWTMDTPYRWPHYAFQNAQFLFNKYSMPSICGPIPQADPLYRWSIPQVSVYYKDVTACFLLFPIKQKGIQFTLVYPSWLHYDDFISVHHKPMTGDNEAIRKETQTSFFSTYFDVNSFSTPFYIPPNW